MFESFTLCKKHNIIMLFTFQVCVERKDHKMKIQCLKVQYNGFEIF